MNATGITARTRFLNCMARQPVDRPPLFEEGIRSAVLDHWRQQGLPPEVELTEIFHYDRREEIDIETRPDLNVPALARRPDGLAILREHLEARAEKTLPEGWPERIPEWRSRDYPLMLLAHWGFFEALGVGDWRSFSRAALLLADQPDFARQALLTVGEFAARQADRVLNATSIDAAIFSEPAGGNHGPLISPRMYRELVLPGYAPLLDVLRRHNVPVLIWRTYANTRRLLPEALRMGINCLWAVESPPPGAAPSTAMDYLDIRRQYPELGLIGGFDLDLLRQGPDAVRAGLEALLPPLLAQGGYAPLADGRPREDLTYSEYRAYRQQLEALVLGSPQ